MLEYKIVCFETPKINKAAGYIASEKDNQPHSARKDSGMCTPVEGPGGIVPKKGVVGEECLILGR